MQYWSSFQPTWCVDCSRCSTRRHLRPYDRITDALTTLRWLRVTERVQYKIAVLTFEVHHDSAPRQLGPLVAVADLPGRQTLRSASTSRLVAPPIKLSTVGSRASPVAAAQVWNGLPEAVISSSSLQTIRRQLTTHLFQLSYPHLIFWPFDWHRYSRPCSNVRYLGHSENLMFTITNSTVNKHLFITISLDLLDLMPWRQRRS